MTLATTNGTKAAAQPLRISVDNITVGDMEDIETITGQSFDEIIKLLSSGSAGNNGTIGIPIKVLKALVYVIYRQANPDFTIEDARNVKVGELQLVLAEPDPTEAAG